LLHDEEPLLGIGIAIYVQNDIVIMSATLSELGGIAGIGTQGALRDPGLSSATPTASSRHDPS
jgi:hypothetical protein